MTIMEPAVDPKTLSDGDLVEEFMTACMEAAKGDVRRVSMAALKAELLLRLSRVPRREVTEDHGLPEFGC